MKHIKISLVLFSVLLILIACTSDDIEKDLEKPTITVNYADGFPTGCTQLQKGQTYTFKARATDNVELAAYSLNLHHNFDHHTHDDQDGDCDLDETKVAVNPLIYMENFNITESFKEYEILINVHIPDDIDAGDYHCTFSVTDTTGWQSTTSVDIKIIE